MQIDQVEAKSKAIFEKKELRNVASEGKLGSQIELKEENRNQQSEEGRQASPRFKKMMSMGMRQIHPEDLGLDQKHDMSGQPEMKMVSKKKTTYDVAGGQQKPISTMMVRGKKAAGSQGRSSRSKVTGFKSPSGPSINYSEHQRLYLEEQKQLKKQSKGPARKETDKI